MKRLITTLLIVTASLSAADLFANCHNVFKNGVSWEYTRLSDGKVYGPHKITVKHRRQTNGSEQWGQYKDSEGTTTGIYIFNTFQSFRGGIKAGGRDVVFSGTCNGSSYATGTMYYRDNPNSNRHKYKVTFFR